MSQSFARARTWLLLLSLLIPANLANAKDQPTSAPVAKNVVVIVADDLGLQLGCYGDKQAKTPSIDRLAAESVRFTRAYCTTASCSASRSVLMTGLFNHATGHYGHAHGDGHFSTYDTLKTLPVILTEAGYRTCSIGKYHLAPEATYHFEFYRNEGIQGSRNSVRMAENAKAWIAEKDDRPFFLYWCSTDPHRSGPTGFGNSPKEDAFPGVKPVRFKPEEMQVPAWLPDDPVVRGEWAEYYEATNRFDQGVGTLMQALHETGHWNDTLIILLSDNGPPFPGAKTNLYDPGARLPLIVRDPTPRPSGDSSASPRDSTQVSRLNGGKTERKTTDALVAWVDITPSILDWCGVNPVGLPVVPQENGSPTNVARKAKNSVLPPLKFHGRSFLKALTDERASRHGFDEIFGSHTFHEVTMYYPMRSVISGQHKLIFNIANPLPYPFASDLQGSPTWQMVLATKLPQYGKRATSAYIHRPRFELYDLEADPDELQNLADAPQHAQRFAELKDKLKAWQKQTRDPWVTKWDYE
ncbi:MAG: sulfatase [Planctomycetia bacterium]|nr:sulfatase [Planctomycetia bacterium]